MATITATWTEAVEFHASASLASGASATDDIDLAGAGYDAALITIEITFGGSAASDCTAELFASSNSGTEDDTIPITSFSIPEATSTTKIVSFLVKDIPYVAVKVTNNDGSNPVTYEGRYAGRKWSSA